VLTLNPNSVSPANQLTIGQENRSGGAVRDTQMFTITR
jgi:hypothetical protein